MPMKTVKRVAVVGLGLAGIIAIDSLVRERTFDVIRAFERRSGPGGCWLGLAPRLSAIGEH